MSLSEVDYSLEVWELMGSKLSNIEGFWHEVIYRKYNVSVNNATRDDASLLESYNGDINPKYFVYGIKSTPEALYNIPKHKGLNVGIAEDLWEIIDKEFQPNERLDEETKLWTTNPLAYEWGKAEGLYIPAKTAIEATYLLIKKSPAFRKKLMYITKNNLFRDVRKARIICKAIEKVRDLLDRSQGTFTFLPNRESLDRYYEIYKERGNLPSLRKVMLTFTNFIVSNKNKAPLLIPYKRLKLVE